MKQRKHLCAHLVLSIIAVFFMAGPAKAVIIDNCEMIISLPYTINVQGRFCVGKDLETSMTSGYAIEIRADDVVLDFGGFRIDDSSAGGGTNAIGIYTTSHGNITIKNGTIRGFRYGIQVDNPNYVEGQGVIIENVKVDRSISRGISLSGFGNIVRNSQVLNTGVGSTEGGKGYLYGIYGQGRGNLFVNNHVYNMGNGVVAYGIFLDSNFHGLVDNNFVSNYIYNGTNTYGIYVYGPALVKNNSIMNMKYGIYLAAGSKYRDNLTNGVIISFTGSGFDAGNNN